MGDFELSILILLLWIICIVLIAVSAWLGARWARKRGRNTKLWGFLAGFLAYNVMLWDFIPTQIAYRYYCEKEAGFTVYKTPQQWRAENPDVVVGPIPEPEGLVYSLAGTGKITQLDGTILRFFPGSKTRQRSLHFSKPDGSYGYWYNDHFIYERKKQFQLFR